MAKLQIFTGKSCKIFFIGFFTFAINPFVSALNPDPNMEIEKDARISINPQRINRAKYAEGDLLVRFKPKVSRHSVDAIADANMSTVARRYGALTKVDSKEYALLKSKHRTTQQMIQALQKNPQVEAVSPNFYLRIDSDIPNDTHFDYLWGLHNTGQFGGPSDIDIDAPEAWDITTGSSSVIVGVIDTGIDYNHPDLIPNMWVNPGEVVDGVDNDGNGYIDDIHGINAIVPNGDPMDDHSHGTHCAGIIGAAGNNDLGVAGVNWNVRLIGAKFLDETGYGTDADAIECIDYLTDLKITNGQNIVAVNASFGGGDYDPVMESAISSMGTAGIIFCAAAGNDWMNNDETPHYPSSYTCSNIIAVTAVDWMGWQNFNYGETSVDLGAPGVDILSTISAVYFPQAGDIFYDDMESGSGNWITGGTNDSWGITTEQEIFEEPLYPPPSPPHFWSDSPGVPYLPDTDSWLMIVSDIDLSSYVGQNLYLGFGSAMYLEPGAPVDHGYVEVSGDGGSTWQSLMDFAQYGYYWYIPWYFLIPDSVKTADFRFRFHLVTDFSIEYDGWLIDDVGIGTADYYGYGFKSGTSMAAPHVTGAMALMAAQYPSETVLGRINRILDNVTPLDSLIDTCATEGMLNVYAALTAGVTEYNLTISATAGGTTEPVPGDYLYVIGTPVDVSATPDSGYVFSHWSGDVPSGHEYDNPVTLTMNADTTVTANFIPEIIQYTLDISAGLGGTTDPSPGAYGYDSGSSIEVEAIPDSGYRFSNWTDDVPSGHETDNPVTITMDGNKTISVNFFELGWQATERLTWNSGQSENPSIASDSNDHIHLVWDDSTPGNAEVYYRSSTDGGLSWNATSRLSWNAGASTYPFVAADSSDNLYLLWSDTTPGQYEIYYRRSTDQGVSWSSTQRLTWNAGDSQNPKIAFDNSGNIHLVWHDSTSGDAEFYYMKSTDGGNSWSGSQRLTENSGESLFPVIVISSTDMIHVFWQDDTPGNHEIFYKKSTDGGSIWSAQKRLTWNAGDASYPSAVIESSNTIHLVWGDNTPGNDEVYYKKSTNGGSTWIGTQRLTWNSGDSIPTGIGLDSSDSLHLLWYDATPGNDEIYHKESTDGGGTWSSASRLTWNSGDSKVPKLGATVHGIHIVWCDSTPGDNEIYYKKRY